LAQVLSEDEMNGLEGSRFGTVPVTILLLIPVKMLKPEVFQPRI